MFAAKLQTASSAFARCSVGLALLLSSAGPAEAAIPSLCPALESALKHSNPTGPVWVHCTFASWAEWASVTQRASDQARTIPSSNIVLTTTVKLAGLGGNGKVNHLPSLIVGGLQKAGTTHMRHLLHQQSIFSAGTEPYMEVHHFDKLKVNLKMNGIPKKDLVDVPWVDIGTFPRDLQARAYSNHVPLYHRTAHGGRYTEDVHVYHKRLMTTKWEYKIIDHSKTGFKSRLPMHFVDVTPAYFSLSSLAKPINRLLPFVRMLFIIRDPVERYRSALTMDLQYTENDYYRNGRSYSNGKPKFLPGARTPVSSFFAQMKNRNTRKISRSPCFSTFDHPFNASEKLYFPENLGPAEVQYPQPGTIKEALAKLAARVRSTTGAVDGAGDGTPIGRGNYVEPLKKWLEVFGSDRIMVVTSDELKNQEDQVIKDIAKFVGYTGTFNVRNSSSFTKQVFKKSKPCPNIDKIFSKRERCLLSNYYAKTNAGLPKLLGRPEHDFPWLARGSNQDCDAFVTAEYSKEEMLPVYGCT